MSNSVAAPVRSLRRAEAEQRAELLEVASYDVRLDLAADERTFRSVTTIEVASRGGATFLDVKPVRLDSVRLNGTPLDVAALDRGRFPLPTEPGRNLVEVDAVMRFRNDGEGLHRSVDPADGRHYVYGMSFMDAAPSVFACFDQPDLKAPYTFHVTAPRDWTVVGNAPGREVEAGPGDSALWELERTQPLSTYFVTLVAGPYHVIRDEHDGIPLGLSARTSLAAALEADADELFTLTRQCFDEYHRLFGIRYPFGNYHQAFVPEFNAGAMENPGCVTFRDPLVFAHRVTRGTRVQRATTVAHEMAHQWFGDIVTPRWWDDLWLNESFAEYLGNRVTADVTEYGDTWTHLAYQRRQWGLVADQRPSTHPVAGNGADDASSALQDFDGISYAKGSSILKQLNRTVGDEVFFGGVADHLTRHRFGNATMHDLFASWERAGAGDLDGFVRSWLRTAGPDTVTLDRGAEELCRTPPPDHPAERTHTLRVALGSEAWRTERVVLDRPRTALELGEDRDAAVVIDPDEDSWGVYVPDAVTLDRLVDLLPGVTDDALRAGAWNNVRSGFHDAALDPARVVDLLVAAPPVEDTEDVGRHLLPWALGQVLPAAPDGSVERLHDAFVGVLEDAAPGSERQLSAFRAAVRTATGPEVLRGWLGALPEGLTEDADLRWRLLVALAGLGGTDRAELDAALAEEPTAHSRVEHTRAVTGLPTAAAKALAWSMFTGAEDVPNYQLVAAGHGLWRGGQEELTAPYVERYFADLPGTAEVRSGWVLAETAEAFFPVTAVDDDTLARTHALAEQPDLEPSLRRRLVDCADDLARKLAVRQRYPR